MTNYMLPRNFELFKMPRRTDNAASANSVEPDKSEECLEFDDEEEEVEEEEIEYEEIEEEIEEEEEVEEDEDVVEEVEEVDEEEDEEEEEESDETEGVSKTKGVHQKDVTEKGKHAELLALPPHGSEVYVGGISSDVSSEDLKRLCEPVGEVVEVRMMRGKDDSRGYAFVNFRTKGLALKVVKELNNAKLKGKRIRVSSSQAKNKLFIGNVPHSWTDDDFRKAVEEVGPGVLKADLMKVSSANRNRGYGFVEYYNHACAEYARQEMSSPTFKLDSNAPTVSWADPKNNDSASTSQVKSVYVKNLPKNVTQAQLKRLFEHHGEIEKVVLPPSRGGHDNRYGFVHFKDRSMAMRALQNTERYELDGQVLDCSLAKPPAADKKDDRVPLPSSNGAPLLPSYPPLGYGIMSVPGAYGAAPASTAQPMLYAPRAPPGAAMVPMMLPDDNSLVDSCRWRRRRRSKLDIVAAVEDVMAAVAAAMAVVVAAPAVAGPVQNGREEMTTAVAATKAGAARTDLISIAYRQFTSVSHMEYEISGQESEVDSEVWLGWVAQRRVCSRLETRLPLPKLNTSCCLVTLERGGRASNLSRGRRLRAVLLLDEPPPPGNHVQGGAGPPLQIPVDRESTKHRTHGDDTAIRRSWVLAAGERSYLV
uniref:RRM domain-containing protein n=1 Tax=Oryza glumipatula TaxID=40148 RepID=A0A0E0BF25_9ORYZ